MKKNNFYILIFFLVISINGYSQVGGSTVYRFLNIPSNARSVALGGYAFAIADSDNFVSLYNPSLLDGAALKKVGLSYMDYFSGMNFATVTYPVNTKLFGVIMPALQYFNYGKFDQYDEFANPQGTFNPYDLVASVGAAKKLTNHITGGINLKMIFSKMDEISAFGVGMDASATYTNAQKGFCAALILRNIGVQLDKYNKDVKENFPTDVQIGVSKRLSKAPIRLMINAVSLNTWDLRYQNTNIPSSNVDPLSGDTIKTSKLESFADNFMRHFTFGLEFIPNKNFSLRVGYNYQIRQEMKVASKLGMVGFSYGFGIRISKFYLSYGRGIQHLAGPKNVFTLTTKISDFIKQ